MVRRRVCSLAGPAARRILLAVIMTICMLYLYVAVYSEQQDYSEADFTENTPTEMMDEDMQKMDSIFKMRSSRIQDLCRNSPDTNSFITEPRPYTLHKLYIDRHHNITWCPTYKAGSSAWMKIFALLGDVLTPQTEKDLKDGKIQFNYLVRRAFPVIQDLELAYKYASRSRRLLVVRHPFERLLSAYRDKLEHRNKFYHQHYGHTIMKLYNTSEIQRVPTFIQFLQYVADKRKSDEHWMPYDADCAPCTMNYQFILKLETIQEEQRHLARKMHLKEFMPYANNYTHTNPSGRTGNQIAAHYYGAVPKELLIRVYKVYANDFKLFDYSPQEYLNMAKKRNTHDKHTTESKNLADKKK